MICEKCKFNRTPEGLVNGKVVVEMRCRKNYTHLYMTTHENIKGYVCVDFEDKE